MSVLRTLIEHLRREVLSGPCQIFEAGRKRQSALARQGTVANVLTVLADDREHTYPARDALTRALLTEHRDSGEAFWSSVLLVAYYPMLSRLRHRLVSDAPRDELDQMVITAFLAVLRQLPVREYEDRAAMRLRQRTARQVFAWLRKDRVQQHHVDIDGLAEVLPAPAPARDDRGFFDLALLLERAVKEGIPESSLEIVAATTLRREPLRSYVDRTGPRDDIQRKRMYQRLKRQRTRTLQRLRDLLTNPASCSQVSCTP